MLEKPAPKQAPAKVDPLRQKLQEVTKRIGPDKMGQAKGMILTAFLTEGYATLNPKERELLAKRMTPDLAWIFTKMLGQGLTPLLEKIMGGQDPTAMPAEAPPAPTSEFGPMSPEMSMGPASAPPTLVGQGAPQTGGMAAPFPG